MGDSEEGQSVFIASLGKSTPGETGTGGRTVPEEEKKPANSLAWGMKERGAEEPAKGRKTGPEV